MTDKEKWINFLKEFDIDTSNCSTDGTTIFIEAGQDNNVRGYIGFNLEINFNTDGKFEYLGIYE